MSLFDTPPQPPAAARTAGRVTTIARAHFNQTKRTYIRLNEQIWGGKTPPGLVLAALGTNAGSLLTYASQLGAALDQQVPNTTAALTITAKIKPTTIAPDGTATLKS